MIAVACLAWVALGARQEPFDPARVDDQRARTAWSRLTDAEQSDTLERFEAEVEYLDTFQGRLVRHARSLEERDLSYLPQDGAPAFYDSAVHAPGQPIPRKPLAWDAPDAVRERERMFKRFPSPTQRSAWRYDWGTREVRRAADLDDPERRMANALAGFPPQLDLAQALVERALDDGSYQKELAAFSHAYTDRQGTVFPGLTLYDAWASGEDMEMPDVDVLGLVHELVGEWRTWVAPVPASQHDRLYETVGKLFAPAKTHRELRTAIAQTFALGSPQLRPPYSTCVERFHALWEAHASTPSKVASVLPTVEAANEFVVRWSLPATDTLGAAALARRRTLDDDARRVRELYLRILAETGAFERKARPPPPPLAGERK